jgi:hypothetical protein
MCWRRGGAATCRRGRGNVGRLAVSVRGEGQAEVVFRPVSEPGAFQLGLDEDKAKLLEWQAARPIGGQEESRPSLCLSCTSASMNGPR